MIIGLTGYKGHGKNFYAPFFVENGYTPYAMANPIREVGKVVFGWTDEQMDGEGKEKVDLFWGISFREFATTFGTEYAQKMLSKKFCLFKSQTGRRIWVKWFIRWYEKSPIKDIVITDIRFLHEVEAIYKLGGVVIRIVRPNRKPKRWWQFWVRVHDSEKHVMKLPVDYEIENLDTDTVDDCRKKVRIALEYLDVTE